MLGASLALLSAAAFGLNTAALRRGVLKGTVLQALSLTVPMGVPLFGLAALGFMAAGAPVGVDLRGALWFALAGVVHFVAGRYGNYRATQAMGANLSGPVQQMSILVALVLAMTFLGESLSLLGAIGVALVVVGPFVMLQGRKRGQDRTRSGFTPDYPTGLFWGGVCALGYGTSPLFISLGLQGAGIGVSLTGGLVSYAAASIVIAGILLLPGRAAQALSMERGPAFWFMVSGLFVFLSQASRYAALAVAPVSVVAPIQRLSVVFRVLFGWLLNRDHEVFGVWVLTGIAVSLFGAALLALSVDWVAAALPAAVGDALRLSWP